MVKGDRSKGAPHVEFKLDDVKLKAIRECLRKGTLKLSIEEAKVSITPRGMVIDAYAWD